MQEFDKWNEVKKETHKCKMVVNLKPREMYWVKIGKNIGDEEYGKNDEFVRPVIVIRRLTSDLFFGIPTTTNNKDGEYFQTFVHRGSKDKLMFSTAMILQTRVFSIKRLKSRICKISEDEFKKIMNKLGEMINPSKPLQRS